jgi:hypothetical protein
MTAEDEEFNRVEMESRIKQEYVRAMNREENNRMIGAHQDHVRRLMEELAIARICIRELGDRLAKLEKPLVAEKEREACALICDAVTQDMSLGPLEKYRAAEIAKLIRARGQA